jgi:hypothetical protein
MGEWPVAMDDGVICRHCFSILVTDDGSRISCSCGGSSTSAAQETLAMPSVELCPRCGGHEFTVEFEEHDKGDHQQITAAIICETCPEDVDTQGPRVESLLNDDEDAEEEASAPGMLGSLKSVRD